MTSKARLFLSLPLVLVIVAGCKTSATPGKVSGKVTYKEKPVPAGVITFHTEKGAVFYCSLNPDGGYSLTDLPTGEMTVTVETESVNPKGRPEKKYGGGRAGGGGEDYMKKMMERGAVPGGAPAPSGEYVQIPKKYADVKTSDLKADVKKGSNTFNFDLKD